MTDHPMTRTVSPSGLTRGWCPRGARVMWAADGALIRLRLAGNRIAGHRLAALLPIVYAHADNDVLVTRRGKLELRGVADPEAAISALRAAYLLEPDPLAELPDVIVWADDEHRARSLDQALRAQLSDVAGIARLPDKFMIEIDGRIAQPPSAMTADIALKAVDATRWRLTLGGAPTSTPLTVDAAEAPIAVCRVVTQLLAADCVPRIRDLSAACREALLPHVARDAPPDGHVPKAIDAPDARWRIRFVFGLISIDALNAIIDIAGNDNIDIRPDRCLILPRPTPEQRYRLYALGALDNDDDPRAGLTACVGRAGCIHATTDTRADALALAAAAPDHARAGLHVSGCIKGCAGRAAAATTLVGRNARYDWVSDGGPGDAPSARGLTLAEVQARFAGMPRRTR